MANPYGQQQSQEIAGNGIVMCANSECPSAMKCWRFTAKPSQSQEYEHFKPDESKQVCRFYWDNYPNKVSIAGQPIRRAYNLSKGPQVR